jgi:hypothetical protein
MYLGTLESVGLRVAAATIFDPAATIVEVMHMHELTLLLVFLPLSGHRLQLTLISPKPLVV